MRTTLLYGRAHTLMLLGAAGLTLALAHSSVAAQVFNTSHFDRALYSCSDQASVVIVDFDDDAGSPANVSGGVTLEVLNGAVVVDSETGISFSQPNMAEPRYVSSSVSISQSAATSDNGVLEVSDGNTVRVTYANVGATGRPDAIDVSEMRCSVNVFTWQGPTSDSEWTNSANWVESGFPDSADDVVVFGDVLAQDTTVTIASDVTITGLVFEESTHEYTVGVGAQTDLIFDNPGISVITLNTPNTATLCGRIIHSCIETETVVGSTLVFEEEITGVAAGVASLILGTENFGTVVLAGKNSFTGEINVLSGVLQLSVADAIPPGVALRVDDDGVVSVDGGITHHVTALYLGGVQQPPGLYGKGESSFLDGDGFLQVPAGAASVPTLGEWGLILLVTLVLLTGMAMVLRRQHQLP